jgi:NADH:ubiquinone oxidoreductase subunit E
MDDEDPRPATAPIPHGEARPVASQPIERWRPAAHHVRICVLASCQADPDGELRRALEERLGIGLDERSVDGAISFEGLECIGLCDIAQSVTVDDEPVIGRGAVLDAIDELIRRP